MSLLSFLSFIFLFLITTVLAQYNHLGCYSQDSIQSLGLASKGTYVYQSVSYCQQQCAGANVVALLDGGECYCGDSVDNINSLSSTSSSSCNVPCNGWPYQYCGGSSNIDLYVNADVVIPTATTSAAKLTTSSRTTFTISPPTTSTSSTSTTTSISTKISSSPKPTTSSSSSTHTSTEPLITSTKDTTTEKPTTTNKSSIITTTLSPTSSSIVHTTSSTTSSSEVHTTSSTTQSSISSDPKSTPVLTVTKVISSSNHITTERISYVTSIEYSTNVITKSVISKVGGEQTTVYVTATSIQQITTATTTMGLSALNRDTTSHHRKLSGGAIAGIVVGVVCGVILLVAILIFLFFRRRATKPDEYTEYKETIQHQPYSFGETDHNATVIPVIPTDVNWMSPKSKHTSDSFGGSSKTEFVMSPSSHNNVVRTTTNPSFIFEVPHYYDNRDIFSASSVHNADEGMLHIVNPDDPAYQNDLNKNETNISTNDPDSSNTSNEFDDTIEKI